MIQLSDAALPTLARRVRVPGYDRSLLTPSVVHIGVGGFHRAHQAVYLDALARQGCMSWGETGVGLRSRTMHEALPPQDCLFTVVERGTEGERARVVGVMSDYLHAPDSPAAVIARIADSRTRVVSLTLTAEGYNLDSHGRFRDTDPVVQDDLRNADSAQSWFALVTAALARRRAAGQPGLTVLSCDNLTDSGAAARKAVVSYASLRDETLAAWIERNVAFPDAMVDRITPGADDALRSLLARNFGVLDRSPVSTEPYRQWVVEDTFAQGRPPLDDVGVQMVADVTPYKLIKSRLLNGAHSAMAYVGHLAGHATTAGMMGDPDMRVFVEQMMRDEIRPLLPEVEGMHLDSYVETLLERLANPSIGDPLSRLCGRGSTKVPAYLLPSLIEARRVGRPAPLLTFAVAAWFRYLRGTDLGGAPITIKDARLDELQPLALRGASDPAALLSCRSVMGALGDDITTRRDLRTALEHIENGLEAALVSRLHIGRGQVISFPVRAQRRAAMRGSELIS